MRKKVVVPLALLFCLVVQPALADLSAIHRAALPQETAVLDALDDAQQLAPYAQSWTINWHYPISKAEVATRLSKDLAFLVLAVKRHPGNENLLLLTGLVARYAYNLDVQGSYGTAMKMFSRAQALSSGDVRPTWFRATLECQTDQPGAGAEEFLAIGKGHVWDQLPVAFWDDYIQCASVTNMPAHVLRAAYYLKTLHAPSSGMRTFLVGVARKRFVPFNPAKTYKLGQIWRARNVAEDTVLTSTTCGVRFRVHGNWAVSQMAFNKGICLADFRIGPYKGAANRLRPSILLLVRQPQGLETLREFETKYAKIAKGADFKPFTPVRCPAARCIAMIDFETGLHGKNGDGHGRIIAFERDQPKFPGLIFESPSQPHLSGAANGVKFYRPTQTQERMPGKLYYLVMLDSPASIKKPAMKDFDFFLQNLVAE